MHWVITGLLVGFVGALVGAGGGFLLMPILLLIYHMAPADAAAVSLVTVGAASLAGTIAYTRQRQVDFRMGVSLALFAIPGALVGAGLAGVVPRGAVSLAFGLLLALLGCWMALGRVRAPANGGWTPIRPPRSAGMNTLAPVHAGMVLVGGLAALFGIGGGPMLVPLLAFGNGMEVHRAAATSQLIILLSSAAAVAAFGARGAVAWGPAAALAAGALLGAPLGAAASLRLPARRLLQFLGFCLIAVGIRLAVR